MKKLVLMSSILAFRLFGVLMLFVLVARKVTVEDFGMFSACFGAAAILSFLVDFGFAQSLLRDIARVPENALGYVNDGVSLKLLLSVLVFGLTCVFLMVFPNERNPFGLQILLLTYFIFNSFSEFYGVSMRAIGRYGEEAVLQVSYTVSIVLILVFFRLNVYEIASVMSVTQAARLAIMHVVVTNHIGTVSPHLSMQNWMMTARRGAPYAMDVGVSNVASNVDVLIVANALGLSFAGVYQAGQKLVQGISASALVVSNVYLPKLSKFKPTQDEFKKAARQVVPLMTSCAAIGFGVLFIFPSPLVDALYGTAFYPLKAMLPLFGILLAIKFLNGTVGLFLIALGKQKTRMLSNVVGLIVLLAASPYLIAKFGLIGMVHAQVCSALVIASIYIYSLVCELCRANG